MKSEKRLSILLIVLASGALSATFFCGVEKKPEPPKQEYTNVTIENKSTEDSVKVYVTLQAPNTVVGLFGIKDTIGSCIKGYFYAHKGDLYQSNTSESLLGVVVSFGGDNLPCQVAVKQGFYTGINIFEFSVNIGYESFDISCEDGVNSIIKASVTDTVNWTTGEGDYIQKYRTAQNTFPILDNIGIRGVFPYRCTDCKDQGSAVPENCFNLRDTCNTQRICQTARTDHKGGAINIEYLGKAWEPAE